MYGMCSIVDVRVQRPVRIKADTVAGESGAIISRLWLQADTLAAKFGIIASASWPLKDSNLANLNLSNKTYLYFSEIDAKPTWLMYIEQKLQKAKSTATLVFTVASADYDPAKHGDKTVGMFIPEPENVDLVLQSLVGIGSFSYYACFLERRP